MSWLKIFTDSNPENYEIFYEEKDIAKKLSAIGIGFSRWTDKASSALNSKSSSEDILSAYKADIEEIMDKHKFKSVDIINLDHKNTTTEKLKEIREKFLKEHIHSDDEVRYFIDGQGLFCIHQEDKVYQILCCKDDFISVPANAKHWFDTGEKAFFKCIRFFSDEAGWVAQYTGSEIASKFPKLELQKS